MAHHISVRSPRVFSYFTSKCTSGAASRRHKKHRKSGVAPCSQHALNLLEIGWKRLRAAKLLTKVPEAACKRSRHDTLKVLYRAMDDGREPHHTKRDGRRWRSAKRRTKPATTSSQTHQTHCPLKSTGQRKAQRSQRLP